MGEYYEFSLDAFIFHLFILALLKTINQVAII